MKQQAYKWVRLVHKVAKRPTNGLFQMSVQIVKVLSRFWALGFQLALIRPLIWGKYITSLNFQCIQKYEPSKLKNEKNLWFPYLNGSFFVFQIWQLAGLEPLGVQRRYVSHFKGLIRANWNPRAQGHDGTFTFCHALGKKVILQLKIDYRPKL